MTDKLLQNLVDPILDDSITMLIRQGKHDDAWDLTLNLDEIFRLYYQIQIKLNQCQYIQSLKLIQEALNLTQNHSDSKIKNIWYKLKFYQIAILLLTDKNKGIEAYNKFQDIPQQENEFTLGMSNFILGLINNDPNYLQQSIDYLMASEEYLMSAISYNLVCHSYGGKKGLELADKAIEKFQQINLPNAVSSFSCLKGYFYQSLGDYKMARLFNTKALEECTKTNFEWGMANACSCLGSIAIEEGNVSEGIQSLEFAFKVIVQDLGYFPVPASLLEAYRYSGIYKQGLEMALDLLKRITIFPPASYDNFFVQVILLVLDMDKLELAKDLYERFKSLVGSAHDSRIENSLKLCQALILKQSKSLRTSYESQSMLRELLQTDTLTYHLRIEAIKHLCELLLLEYEFYEREEILEEIQEYINNLSDIAKEQNLIRLSFEAQIITSKLELLKKDISLARQVLVELDEYAKANNLSTYEKVVSREIAVIDENYNKWLDMVEGNSSMRELMEKTNIKNYMTNAIKLVDILKQD